ncbi:MAG: winged helix-turn-helix domain-containing protein [Actinomycetota bacterium]|nr:winged helix-turn-helix domain-containing protein [Actinomycetota bacterium]
MTAQPRVRDLTTPRTKTPQVETALHGAADLLIALWLVEGCDEMTQSFEEYGLGADWFATFSDGLSPETRSLLDKIRSGNVWISAMSLLENMESGSTTDEFINHVESMDPAEFRLALLAMHEADSAEYERLAPAAAAGDRQAVAELMDLPVVADHERWADTMRELLALEPRETTDLIVGAMRGVHTDVFVTYEKEFRPILERDLHAKQAMIGRLSTERFVELATNGISIEKQGYRRPMLLIPSVVGRPWNIFTESSNRMIIAYPVADEYMDADPDAPPTWLIKTYKALGDERRLRILRRLSHGPASLHELADELAVSKSTLHHHMMLLRSAGLVKVLIGADQEYALREDIVPETTAVLQAYIDNTGGT